MILKRSIFTILFVLFVLSSCTVTHEYTKDDYEDNEKTWLSTIALALEKGGPESEAINNRHVQKLYLDMSRDIIGHHHEYIIRRYLYNLSGNKVMDRCRKYPELDGILLNRITLLKKDEGDVELAVESSLIDCRQGDVIWEAHGDDVLESDDEDLTAVIDSYRAKIGEDVKDYVAPFYLLMTKLYESVPDPDLTDDDIITKIDVDAEGPIESE